MSTQVFSIPAVIRDPTSASAQPHVWTPEDLADLGARTAVDKALHRLVASKSLRRIACGLYDIPQDNRLAGKLTYPNPSDVIDALARKGKVGVVVDGLTASNDLGLTDAVPAHQCAHRAEPGDPDGQSLLPCYLQVCATLRCPSRQSTTCSIASKLSDTSEAFWLS